VLYAANRVRSIYEFNRSKQGLREWISQDRGGEVIVTDLSKIDSEYVLYENQYPESLTVDMQNHPQKPNTGITI
jgi:hypothetical protein